MCKTKTIQYDCGHKDRIRLSTCSGTYSFRPGVPPNAPKAECHHDDHEFVIQSEQDCGYCQRERAVYHLERAAHRQADRCPISQSKSGSRADAEGLKEQAAHEAEVRADFEAEKARILSFPVRYSKAFPVVDYLGAKYSADQRDEAGRTAQSPLREEVKPEDVIDEDEEWSAGRALRSKHSLDS